MLPKIIVSILSFSVVLQTAVAATCCICQTGLHPRSQRPWFQMGCEVWLREQSDCGDSRIESFNDFGILSVPPQCEDGKIRLGYVGHWSSAEHTLRFIVGSVVPTAEAHRMDVELDNTACSGMNDAQSVQRELQSLSLPFEKYIRVKGNQADSVGLWESMVPGKPNFPATADSRRAAVIFPPCEQFENKVCLERMQKNQSGTCATPSGNRDLTCCRPRREFLSAPNPEDQRERHRGYRWTEKSQCREVQNRDVQSSDGKPNGDGIATHSRPGP